MQGWVQEELAKKQAADEKAAREAEEARARLEALRSEKSQGIDAHEPDVPFQYSEESAAPDAVAALMAVLKRYAPATLGEQESLTETQELIVEVCDEFRDFILAKNRQYGDSAIHPVRVFSKVSDEEQLLCRMDDKLSRLMRGDNSMEPDDDIMDDLVGYWILLKVLRRKAARAASE